MPARRQRSSLCLAVPDDAEDIELRVVEGGAIGVDQRIAQLATFMNRSWSFRRGVARDAARKRELAEQLLQTVQITSDAGIGLAVGSLEVGVGDHRRTAVAGAADEDRV